MQSAGKLIKTEKWWNDKAPPALGIAYFLMATSENDIPLGLGVATLVAFMTSFIGVAGFGHIINDLYDVDNDRTAGKHNTMDGRTSLQTALIMLFLLALAWLPWFILPANPWNLSLLGLQLLLLSAYATPPLRLKVRAVPGVIVDALYAYTVPALITWTTFGHISGEPPPRPFLLATLIIWSLFPGLRGILNHQCLDADNDARSGVTTFATQYGRARTLRALFCIVLPAEAVCFVTMTAALSCYLPFYVVGVVIYFGWRIFQLLYLRDESLGVPWRLAPESTIRLYGYELLGEFYTKWFPLMMLAALSLRWPMYLALTMAHLAFFRNGLGDFFRYDLKYIPAGVAKMMKRDG